MRNIVYHKFKFLYITSYKSCTLLCQILYITSVRSCTLQVSKVIYYKCTHFYIDRCDILYITSAQSCTFQM